MVNNTTNTNNSEGTALGGGKKNIPVNYGFLHKRNNPSVFAKSILDQKDLKIDKEKMQSIQNIFNQTSREVYKNSIPKRYHGYFNKYLGPLWDLPNNYSIGYKKEQIAKFDEACINQDMKNSKRDVKPFPVEESLIKRMTKFNRKFDKVHWPREVIGRRVIGVVNIFLAIFVAPIVRFLKFSGIMSSKEKKIKSAFEMKHIPVSAVNKTNAIEMKTGQHKGTCIPGFRLNNVNNFSKLRYESQREPKSESRQGGEKIKYQMGASPGLHLYKRKREGEVDYKAIVKSILIEKMLFHSKDGKFSIEDFSKAKADVMHSLRVVLGQEQKKKSGNVQGKAPSFDINSARALLAMNGVDYSKVVTRQEFANYVKNQMIFIRDHEIKEMQNFSFDFSLKGEVLITPPELAKINMVKSFATWSVVGNNKPLSFDEETINRFAKYISSNKNFDLVVSDSSSYKDSLASKIIARFKKLFKPFFADKAKNAFSKDIADFLKSHEKSFNDTKRFNALANNPKNVKAISDSLDSKAFKDVINFSTKNVSKYFDKDLVANESISNHPAEYIGRLLVENLQDSDVTQNFDMANQSFTSIIKGLEHSPLTFYDKEKKALIVITDSNDNDKECFFVGKKHDTFVQETRGCKIFRNKNSNILDCVIRRKFDVSIVTQDSETGKLQIQKKASYLNFPPDYHDHFAKGFSDDKLNPLGRAYNDVVDGVAATNLKTTIFSNCKAMNNRAFIIPSIATAENALDSIKEKCLSNPEYAKNLRQIAVDICMAHGVDPKKEQNFTIAQERAMQDIIKNTNTVNTSAAFALVGMDAHVSQLSQIDNSSKIILLDEKHNFEKKFIHNAKDISKDRGQVLSRGNSKEGLKEGLRESLQESLKDNSGIVNADGKNTNLSADNKEKSGQSQNPDPVNVNNIYNIGSQKNTDKDKNIELSK